MSDDSISLQAMSASNLRSLTEASSLDELSTLSGDGQVAWPDEFLRELLGHLATFPSQFAQRPPAPEQATIAYIVGLPMTSLLVYCDRCLDEPMLAEFKGLPPNDFPDDTLELKLEQTSGFLTLPNVWVDSTGRRGEELNLELLMLELPRLMSTGGPGITPESTAHLWHARSAGARGKFVLRCRAGHQGLDVTADRFTPIALALLEAVRLERIPPKLPVRRLHELLTTRRG